MNPWSLFAAVVAVVTAIAPAAAQNAPGNYPSRPVSLIIPYGAGGVADVGLRILCDKLSTRLNQQFVVENRPGAGGIVAAQAAAAAAPDGYTLFMTGNNSAIAAALFKSLPYNVLTDFSPVSTASFFDLLIVARAGSPLKSVPDIIQAARANPGKLNIGTITIGSTQNLAAELFAIRAGIRTTIVPFRTSPDMAGAVMRGDVDVAFEFYAALGGLLADGKIVALASTGLQRTAYLPDVPTVIETGVRDFDVTSWNGISVPAATPPAIVATLNGAIKDVMPDPGLQAKARQVGMEMRSSTPADMAMRMKADIAKWSAVIDQAGIPRRE